MCFALFGVNRETNVYAKIRQGSREQIVPSEHPSHITNRRLEKTDCDGRVASGALREVDLGNEVRDLFHDVCLLHNQRGAKSVDCTGTPAVTAKQYELGYVIDKGKIVTVSCCNCGLSDAAHLGRSSRLSTRSRRIERSRQQLVRAVCSYHRCHNHLKGANVAGYREERVLQTGQRPA